MNETSNKKIKIEKKLKENGDEIIFNQGNLIQMKLRFFYL